MKSPLLLIIAFFTAGGLIGLLISTQLLARVPIQGTHPAEVLESQQELISLYIEEQGVLKTKISNLRAEIAKLQEENLYSAPEKELEELSVIKEKLGLTELTGGGIEIVLEDAGTGATSLRSVLDVNDDSLVHAADLRDILNIIFSSNVEGVAVNNQRIIFNSPVNCVGNNILVNNFNMVPPFTISVVTENPQELLHHLGDDTLLFDLYRRMRDQGIIFKFQPRKSMTLPIYNGNLRANYLTAVEENAL